MKLFNKCIYLLIICFGFMSFVSAREIKKTEIAEIDNSLFTNIIETEDGGYFAAGSNFVDDSWVFPAQFAIKLDKNGKVEWEYRDDYIFSMFSRIKETKDGYVAVGSLGDPSYCNIIKFDKNGEILWEGKRCVVPDSVQYESSSSFNDVLVDDTDIIAIGSTNYNYSGGSFSGGYIVKYDKEGNILWKKEAPTASTGYGNIIMLSDNTYLVTGSLRKSSSNICGYIVNYDKDGKVLSEITQCEDGKDVIFEDVYNYNNTYYIVTRLGGKSYTFMLSGDNWSVSNNKKIGGDYYVVEYSDGLKYDNKLWLVGNSVMEANFNFRKDYVFLYDYLLPEFYLGNDTYSYDIFIYNADIEFYDYDKNLLFEERIKVSDMSSNKTSDRVLVSSVVYNEEATKNSEIYKSKILLYELMYDVEKNDSKNGAFDVEQNSNLGKITVTPDAGYVLGSITIVDSNGNNIDYYEEDGYYYFEMNDDVTVNVTYELKEESSSEDVEDETKEDNPETNDISLSMIIILISAIVIYIVSYKGLKKKSI